MLFLYLFLYVIYCKYDIVFEHFLIMFVICFFKIIKHIAGAYRILINREYIKVKYIKVTL
jgi:hypothetical protein